MPTFVYKATDKNGREIKGQINAGTEDLVIERLRNMGYFPTEIKKVKTSAAKADLAQLPIFQFIGRIITRGKVKERHLTAFTRQMATLIGAGLPLLRSLRILQEQVESNNLKRAITQIADDVEGGSTFTESLSRHPKIFSRLYVNMIKAGETSGALEQVLDRLAIFAEKAAALRSKIKSALMYPIVVMVVAGGIVALILLKVVPKFEEIYTELGAKLPGLTRLLIKLSHILVSRLPYVIVGIIALVIIYRQINKTSYGKFIFDRIKLKLPVFGGLLQKAAMARFARTFGTLLDTGVPILQALNIVRDTSGNEVVARAVQDVHASIREGETVAEPLRAFPVFPPLVVHMIAVGEETGAIDQMLIKVAEAYEREVDAAVDGLTALIEPILIVCLGGIVGFIVVALYLPMFKITEVIK